MQHVADEKRKNPEAAKGTKVSCLFCAFLDRRYPKRIQMLQSAATDSAPQGKEGDQKKAVEQEIAKEMHTQDALQKMIASQGSEKTKQIARQQLAESVTRVEKLKNEMTNPVPIFVTQDVSEECFPSPLFWAWVNSYFILFYFILFFSLFFFFFSFLFFKRRKRWQTILDTLSR